MDEKMQERVQVLKKSILEQVPQVPYVLDQVGFALKLCVEYHDEGVVIKVLETALDVAKYTKKVSELNFYKTHLLIGALIGDIPNILQDERFKIFDTASKSVEETIKKITIDEKVSAEKGCFNSIALHLALLARADEDCLVVMLYGILHDLEEVTSGMKGVGVKNPITPQDYITILGYAYVILNFRMNRIPLLNTTKEVLDKIEILLNTEVIY